jgi:hypothetical protein
MYALCCSTHVYYFFYFTFLCSCHCSCWVIKLEWNNWIELNWIAILLVLSSFRVTIDWFWIDNKMYVVTILQLVTTLHRLYVCMYVCKGWAINRAPHCDLQWSIVLPHKTLHRLLSHRLVFSVTLPGNGFQRRRLLWFRAHDLAGWRPSHTIFILWLLASTGTPVSC